MSERTLGGCVSLPECLFTRTVNSWTMATMLSTKIVTAVTVTTVIELQMQYCFSFVWLSTGKYQVPYEQFCFCTKMPG